MNQSIKSVIFFISGVAAGAGGMWYVMRKKNEADLQAMNDYIDRTYRVGESKNKPLEKNPAVEKIMNNPSPHAKNAEKELIDSYRETLKNVPYGLYSKPNVVAVEEDMPEEDEERAPYVITEEEWADPSVYHEVRTLAYDIRSKTLVDMATAEELEIDPTIGFNVFNILDQLKPGSFIYVRNDQTSTDYEIEVREIEEEDYEI